MTDEKTRSRAWQLSLAGYAPFAGLALAALFVGQTHPLFSVIVDALRTYAAVILSFLGGIRWGLALNGGEAAPRQLAISVLPSIFGWLALFLPPVAGLVALVAAFAAQGAWDSFSFHAGERFIWFARLRIVLTCLVAVALIVALLAF